MSSTLPDSLMDLTRLVFDPVLHMLFRTFSYAHILFLSDFAASRVYT